MLALTSLLPPMVGDQADVLLSKRTLTCQDWARAANAYTALGEARAIARLKSATKSDPLGTLSTRRGLLCRILFASKGVGLRPPYFGGLPLPRHSMPLSRWPEYPLTQQDGVWFLLAESYFMAGDPEPTPRYVDYCRRAGRFRRSPFAVPTSAQARRALARLQRSSRWKAIRWSYKGLGESYAFSPPSVLDPMGEQTRF